MAENMQERPAPLYNPARVDAAYQLRYSWTGWPSAGDLPLIDSQILHSIEPLWNQDGLRLLEHRWSADQVQLLFSATPAVSPIFLATRAKGRLDHALRAERMKLDFSRKVAVRSVGDTTRETVEEYIQNQVGKEHFVDPNFQAKIQEFTIVCPDVDLAEPAESARGRYWYNLHLVFVVEDRFRIYELETLATIRDMCIKIADKKSYAISRVSVMPDHLHLALRGNPKQSPNEIAYAFQNNLAYAVGRKPLWKETFYAGTIGEYDMNAVRRRVL